MEQPVPPPPGEITQQEREHNIQERAAFLGAMFEASGRMDFNFENQTKHLKSGPVRYEYVYPFIGYSDTRQTKIKRFADFFGGKTLKEGKFDSFRWYIKSDEAAEFARAIQSFTPSRADVIAAYTNWQNEPTPQGKLQEARDFMTRKTKTYPPKEIYLPLVKNPQFVTGVFESRGLISQRSGGEIIKINSQNRSLLEAMQETYGGGIIDDPDHPDSYELYIAIENTGRFLQLITPHMITPIEEYRLPQAA